MFNNQCIITLENIDHNGYLVCSKTEAQSGAFYYVDSIQTLAGICQNRRSCPITRSRGEFWAIRIQPLIHFLLQNNPDMLKQLTTLDSDNTIELTSHSNELKKLFEVNDLPWIKHRYRDHDVHLTLTQMMNQDTTHAEFEPELLEMKLLHSSRTNISRKSFLAEYESGKRDFLNIDLSNIDLSYSSLSGCHFHRCKLENLNLSYSNLDDCQFTECENTQTMTTQFSHMNQACIQSLIACGITRFQRVKFTSEEFETVIFDSIDFTGAHFAHTDIREVHFDHCRLDEIILTGATIGSGQFCQFYQTGRRDFCNLTIEEMSITFEQFSELKIIGSTLENCYIAGLPANIQEMITHYNSTQYNKLIHNREIDFMGEFISRQQMTALSSLNIKAIHNTAFITESFDKNSYHKIHFNHCHFDDCDLTKINFNDCRFTNISIKKAIISQTQFDTLYQQGIRDFSEVTFQNVSFSKAILLTINNKGCQLNNCKLQDTENDLTKNFDGNLMSTFKKLLQQYIDESSGPFGFFHGNWRHHHKEFAQTLLSRIDLFESVDQIVDFCLARQKQFKRGGRMSRIFEFIFLISHYDAEKSSRLFRHHN